MAFFDNQPWAATSNTPTATTQHAQSQWDKAQQHSRPGTASANSEPDAFAAQFEEIDRVVDNMAKNGAFLGGIHGPAPMRHDTPSHSSTRPYSAFAPIPPRPQTMPEYDNMRTPPTGFQNFYAPPRFQTEADQMVHVKRRMAAQRERDLRNYHQEQQYNRNSTVKPDRPASPNAPKDGERRELLGRQHRALYGKDATMYTSEPGSSPQSGGLDHYKPQGSVDSAVQMPSSGLGANDGRRSSLSASRVGMPNFGTSDSAPHSGARTATASPLASPALGSGGLPSLSTAHMGAIGSRLGGGSQSAVPKGPMTPKERSASAASNPTLPAQHSQVEKTTFGAWGNPGVGVWGNAKTGLGVQASVWS